jgi:site-specific DNA recombinase
MNNNLTTLDLNFDENKIASLIINVLTSFADIERDNITQRSRSGLRFSVKNGGSGSGIIKPFGYKKDGKKLVVDEEEAEIVRLIYGKYLEGFGSGQIANLLNERGIKTKYNRIFKSNQLIKTRHGAIKSAYQYVWRDATIINILQNSIYFGARKYKDEIFKIEPIIDEDTFRQVEIIRKEKYNKKNNDRKYDNILRGVIKCPYCNSGYFMHKRKNGKDNAYKCLSKRTKDAECKSNSINIDKLNNALYYFLKETFKIQAFFDRKFVDKIQNVRDNIEVINAEKYRLSKDLQSHEIQLKNLVKSYTKEGISKKIYSELKSELIGEIEKIESKIKQTHEVQAKNESIIRTLNSTKNKKLEDEFVFRKYIKDYITYIKIYDVTHLIDLKEFGKFFTVKNDVVSLIEVKCDLIGTYFTFLLSRYSNYLVELDLLDVADLEMKIPYITDYRVSEVGNYIRI